MKKLKYIAIFIAAMVISSCELDMQPESDLTYNGFWDSEEAARAAHVGIYSSYRNYAYTFWQMGELRSDIWGGNTIESPFGIDLIQNNISSTMVYFGNWANFYGLLHYINDFIKNAPNVPFQYEEDKNHMLGQVYGLRAQVYYTMLKAWGEVPVSTEPLLEVNLEELKKPRAPKAEVMVQIKSDIEKSLEYFGDDNSMWQAKNVYWSKAATLALKGDVYIWSGKVLGGGNADFTEAKNALQQISGFNLVDYQALWGQDNEFNNEFIFAFDYQQDQAGNFYNSFTGRAVDFAGLYTETGAPAGEIVVNGASRFGPSDKTLLLLNDQQDQRNNTFVRLYDDGENHIPFEPEEQSYKGSLLNKFLGIIGDDGSRKNYNNIPMYRYADVLLLLAEAKNNLGEDPSDEINQVRARAYGENYDANVHGYINGTQSQNRIAILDERYKEFIGEGKRWWDLVRAGEGIVFDEIAFLDASEAYKIYYSISESMLANDPELEQTEGYGQ
ncbi:RagB/SusD family nutrient uptake outer membrane protein [Marinilabilia rubra]|uniref:RagB/SusD family nutrient uptake outer membrane protein n=1 Tax=Marinilabilia rubra TaxID=2162893 RepID=A0A2U2BBE4_9BACT|nr:RagB/SusD family nutrient uptake outer membrane protein [Marinilabilia rubra]PWE00379.1 RagB/SusD family nutrient uptake outer membrane protein [Marinilabilia rubra]